MATSTASSTANGTLQRFYFLRAAVAFGWVGLALALSASVPALGPALLAVYIGWDAIANLLDARRTKAESPDASTSGQHTNALVSGLAALVALGGLVAGMTLSVVVFGLWALGAGVLQLVVGLRRRRAATSGQWFMILSGAQSSLAGVAFVGKGLAGNAHVADLAPYAVFGGTYFLLAAITMLVRARRAVTPAMP